MKLADIPVPHSAEVEASVLGGLFTNPQYIQSALDSGFVSEDFFVPRHAKLFSLLAEMSNKEMAVDLASVADYARHKKYINGSNGQTSLIALLAELPPTLPEVTAAHLKRLRELSTQRKVLELMKWGLVEVGDAEDMGKFTQEFECKLAQIGMAGTDEKFTSSTEAVEQMCEHIDLIQKNNGAVGLPYPFEKIQKETGGMMGGELIVIGARPGVGKTAVMLNMVLHLLKNNITCGIVSLEMPTLQLEMRMAAMHSNVSLHQIKTGTAPFDDLIDTYEFLGTAPLVFSDTTDAPLHSIRSRFRALVTKHKCQALFLDYIQLVTAPKKNRSRTEEMAEITRACKTLARDLNVPIVVLAQLNRTAEDGDEPSLKHLRESGSIEQDADVVFFLTREKGEAYKDTEGNWHMPAHTKAKMICAKQRNGPSPFAQYLSFHGPTGVFSPAT